MHDLLVRSLRELRHDPLERRVRGRLGDDTIVDTTRAVLLWEPRRVCPTYAVPAEDIRGDLAPAPAIDGHVPGVLHPGIQFGVHTAAGEPISIAGREGIGFRLDDDDLVGYVALDFDGFDAWQDEDEPVVGHPRDPYHRVDVHRSSRALRIALDGDVVAETTGARLVSETNLPTRFYLPREDVRAELRPTASRTYCPYKGEASWWSVDGYDDLAWSYERPLPDAVALEGLISFWNERVDVYLDGELRRPPAGP
ncbi:MAG TPA: DUF427 domain-containing protein, partial [Solirubrobacteraceae bacterium]|nr:DUF427 domain-containing protein [Solirubrobacteraceae bacterium]